MQSQGYEISNNSIKCDVFVVGAGPAGMMAAITSARAGKKVIVAEQKDIPGKKIYATGNGRCNYTNRFFDEKVFRGDDPRFAYDAFSRFDNDDLIGFMRELGVKSRDIGGYIYPYNEQAKTVAQALVYECQRLGADIRTSEQVVDITQQFRSPEIIDKRFVITTRKAVYTSESVIIAVGGKASPTHGSDGNLNKVIRKLGHNIILQDAALVPLKFEDASLSHLSGVRCKCKVKLFIDDNEFDSEEGEIIFNRDNISGIPVMQLSRYAVKAIRVGKTVRLELDLVPDMSDSELTGFIESSSDKRSEKHDALGLIIYDKVAEYICERTDDTDELIHFIKHFSIEINGDCGFNRAQVTAGGVDSNEVTEDMESKFVKGLFFAGEVLDVDGTCGGYNLQWAFTSGHIAGSAATGFSS